MLGTRLVAGTCGLMQVAIGLLYLGPSQLVRRPLPPDQISVVVYIEQAGPYWVVGFVLSGLMLVAAAVRGKGFVVGHAAGVFVWLFYGGAILLGALVSSLLPCPYRDVRVFLGVRSRWPRIWLR